MDKSYWDAMRNAAIDNALFGESYTNVTLNMVAPIEKRVDFISLPTYGAIYKNAKEEQMEVKEKIDGLINGIYLGIPLEDLKTLLKKLAYLLEGIEEEKVCNFRLGGIYSLTKGFSTRNKGIFNYRYICYVGENTNKWYLINLKTGVRYDSGMTLELLGATYGKHFVEVTDGL